MTKEITCAPTWLLFWKATSKCNPIKRTTGLAAATWSVNFILRPRRNHFLIKALGEREGKGTAMTDFHKFTDICAPVFLFNTLRITDVTIFFSFRRSHTYSITTSTKDIGNQYMIVNTFLKICAPEGWLLGIPLVVTDLMLPLSFSIDLTGIQYSLHWTPNVQTSKTLLRSPVLFFITWVCVSTSHNKQ